MVAQKQGWPQGLRKRRNFNTVKISIAVAIPIFPGRAMQTNA
jgi:hypothetical protein